MLCCIEVLNQNNGCLTFSKQSQYSLCFKLLKYSKSICNTYFVSFATQFFLFSYKVDLGLKDTLCLIITLIPHFSFVWFHSNNVFQKT